MEDLACIIYQEKILNSISDSVLDPFKAWMFFLEEQGKDMNKNDQDYYSCDKGT